MSEECEECEPCPDVGAPAWMATFADLMSLLMCFFVLLLSFSEMDVLKYKQVAGSMKHAFGVQKKIEVDKTPMGTSIIAQEFSPGKPEPTVIKVINQKTVENFNHMLVTINDQIRQEVKELAKIMVESFEEEIKSGALELVMEEDSVRVRIRENDSFPSGSAQLHRSFYPILGKIANVLREVEGRIIVAGHTDDVPISTRVFASNWVLSSARAANVVHHFAKVRKLDPERMEIRAYADTKPVAENDTTENKAKNRRVEIIVNYEEFPREPLGLEDLVEPKQADDTDSQEEKK